MAGSTPSVAVKNSGPPPLCRPSFVRLAHAQRSFPELRGNRIQADVPIEGGLVRRKADWVSLVANAG